MARFFASTISDGQVILSPEERHHAVSVLRMKNGEACQIIWEGLIFEGVLQDAQQGLVTVAKDPLPSPEPSVKVTLYQGVPKGDKMDLICQKCTEAGITRIVPVQMSRCVSVIDTKDAPKKQQRWQRIISEAAKQSGRAVVPQVELPIPVRALPERLSAHELVLVPWEEEKQKSLKAAWQGQKDVAIIIGPEGGMSEKEIDLFGAVPVTLGPRIFRTETAGLAALIALMCLSGNME